MQLESIKNLFPPKVWDYTPAVVLGIGGLWITTKVGSTIYTKISEKLMLSRWDNTPQDVVILHKFLPASTSPNSSPFVIKLETYLRMAKISYQVDEKDCMSVKGKSPWISLNGEHISDSQLCIEFLAKKYGKKMGNYSDEERAIGAMARIMMDEHFCWALGLWRYVFTNGRDVHKFMDFPAYQLNFFLAIFTKYYRKACWYQGIGRHSQEDVIKIALSDMKALSKFIGNKKFLLGDEPCEDDAAIFGILVQLVYCCPDSPYQEAIEGELKNLKEYCLRMKETFWPDWEDCLSGARKKQPKNST